MLDFGGDGGTPQSSTEKKTLQLTQNIFTSSCRVNMVESALDPLNTQLAKGSSKNHVTGGGGGRLIFGFRSRSVIGGGGGKSQQKFSVRNCD